jgi:hypothetical protein
MSITLSASGTAGAYVSGTGAYVTSKAWAYYHSNGTAGIDNEFGFSGLTDHGTGDISLTFSANQPNIYYSVTTAAGDHHRLCQDGDATLVNRVRLRSFQGGTNGTLSDNQRNFVTIHGD